MATNFQLNNLRRRIQDYYSKLTGLPLTENQFAFKDDELINIIDDAAAEVSGGIAAEELNATQQSWCMIIARADAILQIAQDEARRVKWSSNNQMDVDPTEITKNLIAVAETLQNRYEKAKSRELTEKVEGVQNRNAGGLMTFNSTVQPNSQRNFYNSDVQRNTPGY